jgi:uncharacterized membrane protein
VSAGTGFSGTVDFNVTGLPTGATAGFTPTSINASGSTTLNVTTSLSTPAGSYPLTITGTTGSFSHPVNVTLVVNGDFSISVQPPSATVSKGGKATYTVTITPTQGFSGTVNLTVTNLSRSNETFSPPSVVNSGTSTLTVDTNKNFPAGTNTLTITGTSGSRVHSTTVTLIAQ